VVVLAVVVGTLGVLPAAAQRGASFIRVTAVKPQIYLLADSSENLMVFAGTEASLVAGVQSPALVARAKALVAKERAGPVRYAVAMESERALAYGDGGWRASGTTTIAHEYLRIRMYLAMHPEPDSATGAPRTPPRPMVPGAQLPLLTFSQVLVPYFGDGHEEEIHFIRERSGYTDADVIVHFERNGVLYLGNTYTTDGYPLVDTERGGRINGIVNTADFFVKNFANKLEKVSVIVPGRGAPATLNDLREYRDMLVSVRDSVQAMVQAGKSLEETLAARPSAAFDARWGRGPVTSEQFVTAVYKTIPRPKK
jgi:hypothetical protein